MIFGKCGNLGLFYGPQRINKGNLKTLNSRKLYFSALIDVMFFNFMIVTNLMVINFRSLAYLELKNFISVFLPKTAKSTKFPLQKFAPLR